MNKLLRFISNIVGRISWPIKVQKSDAFEESRLHSIIITKAHSIEKGLSISVENIRYGFGVPSILDLLQTIRTYQKRGFNMHAVGVGMAYDAIQTYLDFHAEHGFNDDKIKKISAEHDWLKQYVDTAPSGRGGVLTFHKSELDFNLKDIRKLFYTRHSLREFSGEPVSEELLRSAVEFALRAPSACNRQATRVYVIDQSKYEMFSDSLKNVGGFQTDIDKLLLITGKASCYRKWEHYQYAVSASIFAGYLSLALHAHGIGCCLIQSSVVYYKPLANLAQQAGIPEDEQIVCMAGIGMMKDSCNVPISIRMPVQDVLTYIK